MAQELQGRRIAILATDGFEQVELTEPQKALKAAGADAQIVAPKAGEIQGWNHHDKADRFKVDRALDQAHADDYAGWFCPAA